MKLTKSCRALSSIYLTSAHHRLNKEMSTAKTKVRSKVRLVKSEIKWGRSNRRHFARALMNMTSLIPHGLFQ